MDPDILIIFVEAPSESWIEAKITYSTIALIYNYKREKEYPLHEFAKMRNDLLSQSLIWNLHSPVFLSMSNNSFQKETSNTTFKRVDTDNALKRLSLR